MPRKLKLYVPKGAPRKSTQKGVPSSSEDDPSASKRSDGVEEATTVDKSTPGYGHSD